MALIAVVLVAVAAVVAKLTWRPSSDEDDSVRRYHSALGTMEAISERTGGSGVRVLGRAEDTTAEDGGPSSSGPPIAVRSSVPSRIGPPEVEGELVFDDAGTSPGRTGPNEAAAFGADIARRRALTRFDEPRRGRLIVTLAIVAAVVFGGLAYLGSRHVSRSSPPKSTTAPTSVTHRRTTTSTPATTPPPAGIAASSSTDNTAVYPVGATTYQVTVTAATEASWIDARNPDTGATIWTGTVPVGGSQTIPGNGTMVVELGALAGLSVNGVQVVLPTPAHSPFTATFAPTPAAAAPRPRRQPRP